jgi:hypothetical protein
MWVRVSTTTGQGKSGLGLEAQGEAIRLMTRAATCLHGRTPRVGDTPLRLAVAAVLAYPDGSMTASGLRREAPCN